MIRILLVDDQTLLCEVLKTWLEVEEDFQVIGVAHNGNEALSKIEMLQPDIVLMDIDMPEMDGLNATQIISERFPEVKVIFLSGHDEDDYLGKSLRAGAKGYLLKNTTAEELADKVRYVYHNSSNVALSVDQEMVAGIQTQLEELMETYRHKFQKQLEGSHQSETVVAEYDAKFKRLEVFLLRKQEESLQRIRQETRSTWDSIHKEISNTNTQFNSANRSLSSQVNQQIVNLKKDIDVELNKALEDWSRQRAALQEWAVQRDEMQVSAEDFQSKYRRELMSTINPFRASFRDIDRQIATMRNWLIGSILLAAMSLTFSSWLLASNFVSGNTTDSQIQNQ
ncbi:Response regulator receiver protein [Hyella patelloides LEGE 07179]|uniref:Response regulator receiver protein n=1 Tax=Hyella patelloides LEGE 07179 TaxID=945734 RepID=A0A563W3Z2_9CYAN|nr:response regulator transcription factor [Hyella patelloides]VEP18398.1 Response regulator receiver protein [Hyella patelloides LEGE 07179]